MARIIFMKADADIDLSYISQIMNDFDLEGYPTIRIDGSNHYKCHLDRKEEY